MKKGFLLLMLLMPMTVFGQSTLNFPRIYTQADLALTGFAIVNPSAVDAETTFTLRSASGATLEVETRTITAGGQLVRLGSELFTEATTPGWVEVTTSDAPGLQGFWLGGDFSTFTDGAEAAPSADSLIFPLVGGSAEINIANTATVQTNVTISLRQSDGSDLASSTQTIAGMGAYQSSTAELFPSVDVSQSTHIVMTGAVSIAATAIVTDFLVSPSWGVANGVDAATATTELNFPHVLSSGGWVTTIGVTNLVSTEQTVTITFYPCPSLGTCPGSPTSVNKTLAGNGGLQVNAESLFGFTGPDLREGWVSVAGTSAVTGFVAYAFSAAGGLAIVPAQASPQTSMLFAHMAQEDPWLTGVALLNTSNTIANVEVYVMNPNGTLIGGALDAPDAAFTLDPNAKIARLLNEWIPAAQTNNGFVFVRTTNDVPLYGLELFLVTDIALLANVAPGAIADGITYTPPAPAGTITLDSLSPASVARGQTLTLNGSGFSATTSSNSVVFTTASGTASESVDPESSTTQLTVTVPSTSISGPVLVQSGSVSSSPQILEVTVSSSELLQTSVSVTSGQITTGVDIYVPAPSGSLNLTRIGVGAPGAASIIYVLSSAELTQGQTVDIALAGTGISAANGSTPTVSGSGVILSDVSFSGNVMFVGLVVDSDASVGPRTVTVTNSNLDTSTLSGGIIIK